MQKLEIKYVPIKDIKLYEKNTKKHPEKQVNKIVKSIKEFGFNVPVILNKKNIIIAGHGRILASKKLGIKEVPCIFKENLSMEQIKAYRIADNKSAESDWDFDFLKEEFEGLLNQKYDLEFTGFDRGEIDIVLGNTTKEYPEKEIDENIHTESKCPKCGYEW